MRLSRVFSPTVILLLLLACGGCTQSAQDERASDSGAAAQNPILDPEPNATAEPSIALHSQCGVVTQGALHSDYPSSSAEEVSVEVLNSDVAIVRALYGEHAGSPQLLQFQGISSRGISEYKRQRGVSLIRDVVGYSAFLVSGGCPVTIDTGGQGIIGQLFTQTGQSVNEQLIASGAVSPEADNCGGDVLNSCYSSIPVPEEFSPLVLNNFLWKPVSDNDGNLVIGVDEFVSISVQGALSETHVAERYAGAPYVSFVRFNRPGCSYGNNIRIEFSDENGLRVKTASGEDHVTVASGCSRNTQAF